MKKSFDRWIRIAAISWLMPFLGSVGVDSAIAQERSLPDDLDAVEILIQWQNGKPDHSLRLHDMLTFFHNGEFDIYDQYHPAPPMIAHWMLREPAEIHDPERLATIFTNFYNDYPDAKIAWIWQQETPYASHMPGNYLHAIVTLDPAKHRFFSYYGDLTPSNDAFFANDDPFQVEIFDENGRFLGPIAIDILGSQVMDAGLCENTEAELWELDVDYPERRCHPGEGFVQVHPGLNGSVRNPQGTPKNILGGENNSYFVRPGEVRRRYDETAADFTRPGYRIGRFHISRRWASGEVTGSWYSPDHDGEGFNIQIVEQAEGEPRRRMMVNWYTYTPDDSGEQIWLTGIGEFDADLGIASDVIMYRTQGGRFASMDNPTQVERVRWGRIKLGFGDCQTGRVFFYPEEPGWPPGDYFIYRLGAHIEGIPPSPCRVDNARLTLPEPQPEP